VIEDHTDITKGDKNFVAGLSAEQQQSPIRGIVLMIAAGATFCISSVFVKQLSGDYSAFQIVFIRSFFVIVVALAIAARSGGLNALKTKHPFLHIARGCIGFLSVCSFFYAVQRLPIADAMTAAYCAPLFITALSVPLLKEVVGIRRWAAVVVGFTGVVVVAGPQGATNIALLVAIFSALTYAGVAILIRKMGSTETLASVAFYTAAIYIILGAVISIPTWVPIAPSDWLIFGGIGLFGTIAQILMTASYRSAPVAVVSPFEYTSFVWAIGFDFIIWNLSPAWATLAGSSIIIASGIYIVHRETVQNRTPVQPGSPRVPMGSTFNDPQTEQRKPQDS